MSGPATPPRDPEATTIRILVLALIGGAVLTAAVGIYLGATITPALYALAGVALVDLALAWAYATGRIGPAAQRRREAEASGDAAMAAEVDPTFNPYARED